MDISVLFFGSLKLISEFNFIRIAAKHWNLRTDCFLLREEFDQADKKSSFILNTESLRTLKFALKTENAMTETVHGVENKPATLTQIWDRSISQVRHIILFGTSHTVTPCV